MIKKNTGEVWKQIIFTGHKLLRKKYAVSSLGRAASYTSDVLKDGKLLNGSLTSGYKTLNLHIENGNGTIYIHREVAKLFCKKPSTKYKYVIHVNHKKKDNEYKNLRLIYGQKSISGMGRRAKGRQGPNFVTKWCVFGNALLVCNPF